MSNLRPNLPERDLERLAALVAHGLVVPIVGEGLHYVSTPAGEAPAAALVAARVAARMGVDAPGAALSDLAHAFLSADRRATLDDFRELVVEAVEATTWEPPPLLRELAGIADLRLMLTTSFDPLLALALAAADGRTPLVGGFAANARDKDLPPGWRQRRTVYHLFGRAAPVTRFAVTEEDVLETLLQLQAYEPSLPDLSQALQQAHLLLLGCRFPDWLTRLFLRIARQKRLAGERDEREYLALEPTPEDSTLVRFLERFSSRTVLVPVALGELVPALAARCRAGTDLAASRPAERAPAVFVSYATEDRAMAEVIAEALRAQGLDAWLDKGEHPDRLRAGDDYRRRIQERIAGTELFVPLLSPRAADRAEGFFREEWQWAIERARSIAPDVPFLVPVALDGVSYGHGGIPSEMRAIHWIATESGGEVEVIAEQVKTAIRTVRARRRARGAA